MDDTQVRQIIQDELKKYSTNNMFGISNIPAHAHDNVSGQQIDGNNLVFAQNYFKLPATTAVPTSKPPTGTITTVNGAMYIYNGTAWVTVGGGSTYSGSVGSTGGAINLPGGWSSSQLATGLYHVIHDLGTLGAAGYDVVATVTGVNWSTITLTKNFDDFTVNTLYPTSGTAVDNQFDFIVIPY